MIKMVEKISHKLLIFITIVLIVAIFFVILDVINKNKINFGMEVAGISIGGLGYQEALERLGNAYQKLINEDFSLIYKNYSWKVNLKNLGIKIDVPKTIALAHGRGHEKGKFLSNRFWQIKSFFGYNLQPERQINKDDLEKFLMENLFLIHQPARNSILIYNKKTKNFVIAPSKSGTVINRGELESRLQEIINNFQTHDIVLGLTNEEPEVLETETNAAKKDAEGLLANTPIIINILRDGKTTEIDQLNQKAILDFVDFVPIADPENANNKILGIKLSPEKIKNYLIYLAPRINREPIDAQLMVKNSIVTAFALSQNGIKLKIDENVFPLQNGVEQGAKQIELIIEEIRPKIATDTIENLGITALLSKGVSNFAGSSQNRIHNIRIGAAKFNGILVAPDEEFSFNQSLGEVGPEQGYEPGLVILKDKTAPEYGGGLCQVSTTLFRAAVLAGLKITQRYAHAFPVKYYNPQGFDATIYPPSPDLRFINNTPDNVLIQTKIKGTELIFELYGTEDERRVELIGPEQYDFQPDGSMKAVLTQKVYDKNGNIIINKIFNSIYKSPDLYPLERNPLE
jgi:vancomycin resistance protein YoaR